MNPILRIVIATLILTPITSLAYLIGCVMLIGLGAEPAGNTPLDYLGYGAILGIAISTWFATEVIRSRK